MTTFRVRRTARPISPGMFADLGVPAASFAALPDGGQEVTVPETLTAQQVTVGRIRLMTATPDVEGTVTAAMTAVAGNAAFLALPSPSAAQSVAQVRALTRQVDAIIRLIVAEILGETS